MHRFDFVTQLFQALSSIEIFLHGWLQNDLTTSWRLHVALYSVMVYLWLGTHGSGLLSETHTPLVAWGSGVAGKQTDPENLSLDKAESILQADIAPYMAALLGISIPANSVVRFQLHLFPHNSIEQRITWIAHWNFWEIDKQNFISLWLR